MPNRRGGVYYIKGVPVPLPSVTHILGILDKPQLDYWKRKLVAGAVFENPLIDMKDACAAPDRVRDKAGSKGSDIHRIVESHFKNQPVKEEDYESPWKEYVRAYLDFTKKVPHKILQAETIVHSKEGFAGQYDALVEMNGERYILDYKTSKYCDTVGFAMQLGAYWFASNEMGVKADRVAIVHLKAGGTFNFLEVKPQAEAFLHLLEVYKYLNPSK